MKPSKFGALLFVIAAYCYGAPTDDVIELRDGTHSVLYSIEASSLATPLQRQVDFTFPPSEEAPIVTEDPLSYLFDHTILTRNELSSNYGLSTLRYGTTGVTPEEQIYHSTSAPTEKSAIANQVQPAKKSNYLETIIKNAKMVVNMTGQYRKFDTAKAKWEVPSTQVIDSRSTPSPTEAQDHSII